MPFIQREVSPTNVGRKFIARGKEFAIPHGEDVHMQPEDNYERFAVYIILLFYPMYFSSVTLIYYLLNRCIHLFQIQVSANHTRQLDKFERRNGQ